MDIHGFLVAGSFVDRECVMPGDIDGMFFYRLFQDVAIDWAGVRELITQARSQGVDFRPVPMDGDPLIVVKTISFMTSLYLSRRGDSMIKNNGMILVSVKNGHI